ncbi:MAG: hypothetical protein ACKOX6_18620 [Bdellovibrio sp.]
MNRLVKILLIAILCSGTIACSELFSFELSISNINDVIDPGSSGPNETPLTGKGIFVSPGNQILSTGSTVSAKVGAKVDSRVLKGSSVSAVVSINHFDQR